MHLVQESQARGAAMLVEESTLRVEPQSGASDDEETTET